MKEQVAKVIAQRAKNGDVLGLGSGSTVEKALAFLGERVAQEKIVISGVPTSYRTAALAAAAGIRVISPNVDVKLSWAFDGADEVDPELNLIKGRGGAMLSEKIIASRADRFVVIVSEDKLVSTLGSKQAVPVEVLPQARSLAEEGLRKLGATEVALREAVNRYGPEMTEHGNLILDARFNAIAPELEREIKALTGVVDSGLFIGYAHEVLVARANGIFSLAKSKKGVLEQALPTP